MMFENVEKVLNDFGKRLVEGYREKLDSGNINASYDLYNSVRYMVEIGENRFEVKLELEDYWKYIESGRKPGKFPPVNAILNWILVKPILPRPNDNGELQRLRPKQLAFLIGRKIKEEGIEPYPALKTTKEELDKLYKEKIAEALGRDVRNYISKLFGE